MTANPAPSVWAIVLCYNQIALTLECLDTLLAQDYAALRVLVVDNGSTEGTLACVRARFPSVDMLCTGQNLGYTGGNNAGIRRALACGADAVFLLNNDVRLAPGCVANLARALFARPGRAATGPLVCTWDEWTMISSAGGEIDWRRADARNLGAGEPVSDDYPAREVDFLNGCALMVCRTAIAAAGLLDDRYYMYWDETDWCARMREQGMSLWFEPLARVQHKATLRPEELGAAAVYYAARNRLLFFARHGETRSRPLAVAHALYGILRGLWRDRRGSRHEIAAAQVAAVRDAALGRWGRRAVPRTSRATHVVEGVQAP